MTLRRLVYPVLFLVAALCGPAPTFADPGYAMYVWEDGFDATVPGCDAAKLVAWDEGADGECYTHNWLSPQSKQWLWDTANRPGREIDRLFIAGIRFRLEDAYNDNDCSHPDVLDVKKLLLDGHCEVPGVKLHALFSTNNLGVSEQNHVPYVVWYNDNCAGAPNARFDGVAVNNEAWSGIRCGTSGEHVDYLDNLQAVADAADQQVSGVLETHYSIGWKWNDCTGSDVYVDWEGTDQLATHHMIDIFDSVDVQIATTTPLTGATRAATAGYAYAVGEGKPFYVLSYTNKSTSECQITHFPYDCVDYPSTNVRRTDDWLMTNVFDAFATNGIPAALPAIHAFRQVYSTGGHVDWPSHGSGTLELCIPAAFQGPVTFANPDDDDEISWPKQGDATIYELARADSPVFGAGCRIVATPSETVAVDPQHPPVGGVFYYLVRVLEPQAGNWGERSDGTARNLVCQ